MIPAATMLLADTDIEIGRHQTATVLGLTLNLDTVYTTAAAAVIVVALGLLLRLKITSGVPSGVQLFWESLTSYIAEQVETRLGRRLAGNVVPLAVTLFVFILVANWISVLRVGQHPEPPTSDANLPYALAVLVFVCFVAAGIRRSPKAYFSHFVTPYPALLPINLVEELSKPISLSLRLFGNLFSGTIMLSLIGLFPAYLAWAPNSAWKLFDLFIGVIQALIFALLTIIYFGQAAGEEGH